MKYYLGIDNGSSSVKVALYDEHGLEVCVCRQEIETEIPMPGRCERDMEKLWQINCTVIHELLSKSGIDACQIRALACCGHGKGLYLWGDGKPVYPGILSSDNRAEKYVEKWKQTGVDQVLFERTWQQMMACHPAALMCWFRDNMPQIVSKIRYVFTCKDYIRYRLTGEAYGDLTESSGLGVVNAKELQYDEEIFSLLHLEAFRKCMPPIASPTQICGTVTSEAARLTGLAEGTPVAAGLFDIGAAAIATDAVESKNICMIAGTWNINEYIRRKPVMDGSVRCNTTFCKRGQYLIEESSPTSAANLNWYVSNVLQKCGQEVKRKDIYEMVNKWVESVPAYVRCPVFLPFIYGSNMDGLAESAFVGLHAAHDIRHMTRAVFEGVVFEHRRHLERLKYSHLGEIEEIHLTGGAINSVIWTQMFADVCGYPVRTAQVEEPGALGCAIIAAVAVGDYCNIEEGIAHMVNLSTLFQPRNWEKRVYEKKYHLYQKTVQILSKLQEELDDYDKGDVNENSSWIGSKC